MTTAPVLTDLPDGNLLVQIPMMLKRKEGRTLIIAPECLDGSIPGATGPVQKAMVTAIVRAYAWQELLDHRLVDGPSDLAKRLDMDPSFLNRQLRLAYLAPDIVQRIFNGEEPKGLSLSSLLHPFPELWEAQREKWGF